MNRDDQMMQQMDTEAREWKLLEALQKVHRAGLKDEALLLAFEGGVLEQFRKEIQLKETSNAKNR